MKTHNPQPLTVLFADDDDDELYLFNEALEQSLLQVNLINAKDGRQLLTILRTQTLPDIIFLDLNMPYMDGMETIIEIRKNDDFKNIPVVIFSTSNNIKYIDSCYEKGATYYVVKPENFDDITKVVKKIFALDWKTNDGQPGRSDFVINY